MTAIPALNRRHSDRCGILAGFALAAALYSDVVLAVGGQLSPGSDLVVVTTISAAATGLALLLSRGPQALLRRSFPLLVLSPFVVWLAWSATRSWSPEYGYEKLVLLSVKSVGFTLLVLGALGPRRQLDLRPVLWVGLAIAALVTVAGSVVLEYPGRWTLYGMNPIWLGRIGWTLALVAVVTQGGGRWIRGAAGLAGIGIGMATASRGPAMAFALAVAIWWVFLVRSHGRKRQSRWGIVIRIVLLAIGPIAVSALGSTGGVDYGRVFAISDLPEDTNVLSRIALQREAFESFTRHPLIGTGLGSLASSNLQPYPHNVVLETLAETGLVGMLLAVFVTVMALRHARDRPDLAALLILAILFGLASGDLAGNWSIWFLAAVLTVRPASAAGAVSVVRVADV